MHNYHRRRFNIPEACELDYNLKLLSNCISGGQWSKRKLMAPDFRIGKKSANERKRLRKQRELTPGIIVGTDSAPSGKRGCLGGSSAEKPLPKRRPTAPPEQIELVLSAEGVCLQFKMYFPERGPIVMLSDKDETRDWLRGLAPKLGVGGPRVIGVVCGHGFIGRSPAASPPPLSARPKAYFERRCFSRGPVLFFLIFSQFSFIFLLPRVPSP
ncbi:hypothetical protein J6590_028782 [Homalodisca vitripennis]|nr:hypothetical protein J6590_028782 [Homalodisca vitripennis]